MKTPTASPPPQLSHEADEESAALCAQITKGDRFSFEEVYRRYGPQCLSLARRVTGSSEAAEDVVQIVFVEFWKAADRYDPDRGSLRSLLLAAVHKRSIDSNRSTMSREQREHRVGTREAHTDATRAQGVEDESISNFVGDQLRTAVSALDPRYRRAIELAYFEGMSYREVAVHLDQPEGTIKSHMRVGLKQLRAVFAVEGTDNPCLTTRNGN